MTAARWWFSAAGIRWVPTRPLVESPQTKNVADRNQNVRDRSPSRSPSTAGRNGCFERSGTGTGAVAP